MSERSGAEATTTVDVVQPSAAVADQDGGAVDSLAQVGDSTDEQVSTEPEGAHPLDSLADESDGSVDSDVESDGAAGDQVDYLDGLTDDAEPDAEPAGDGSDDTSERDGKWDIAVDEETGDRRVGPADTGDRLQPLSEADRAAFDAWAATLETSTPRASGPELAYQIEHTGDDTEYEISERKLPLGPRGGAVTVWADGLNSELGAAQDTKYVDLTTQSRVLEDTPRSWYDPDSLEPFLAEQAAEKIDAQLEKYRQVIDDDMDPDDPNPVRGLEIITNHPRAADYLASRMAELKVHGIVRVRD